MSTSRATSPTESTPLIWHQRRKRPVYLALRSSKVFIIFTVAAAVFTDAFLYGVAVPIFPFTLQERAHVDAKDVQWWQSAMLATFGGVMLIASPIFGYYADRSPSRRTPFLLGLAMNIFATVLFGVARSVTLLVISRALQGLASSVVWSVGLAMVCDTVRPDEVGQWMGWVVSSTNFGVIMAPSLGGLIYARAGYYSVVGMCAALLCVDILLRVFVIEKKVAESFVVPETSAAPDLAAHPGLNQESGTSISSEQSAVVNGTHNGSAARHQDAQDREETSVRKPRRIPLLLRLMMNARFASAFYGFAIFVVILSGFDGVLAIYVKQQYHWGPIRAGTIYLTLGLPCLAGPLVGYVGDRIGPRWLAAAGIGSTSLLLVLLGFINQDGLDQPYILILVLIAIGFSLVLIATPMAADMSVVVEQQEKDGPDAGPGYAQAYALLNCANAVGCMVGPIVAGAVIDRYGWRTMNIVLTILTASGLPPAILFTGGPLFEQKIGVQDRT